MRRFTDLFKGLASPNDDKLETPSFIKADRVAAPPDKAAPPVLTPSVAASNAPNPVRRVNSETNNVPSQAPHSSAVLSDKIDVPVYENDSEWEVVQRSINLFAENAALSGESKQAFVKKWVTELAKAEQTMLYRSDEADTAHLGNEINRAAADSNTGLLGTYQAMIDPGRQARMTDELKALRCIEEFDFGIINVHLYRDIKTNLINTVAGTIEEQKVAAQNLVNKAQKGQPEADKIYSSTKALANCREMRLNAAIKTAVLKMDTAKYQNLGLQPDETEPRPAKISVLKTPAAEKREPSKPKVSESDWVDEQALKLFGIR